MTGIITLETGRMARQADGAVLLKWSRTMLLAAVVSAKEARKKLILCPCQWSIRKNTPHQDAPGGFLSVKHVPQIMRYLYQGWSTGH